MIQTLIRGGWLAAALVLTVAALPDTATAQETPAETSDEVRERQVVARFGQLLEKTPRRGTALDRVYGFHVARGKLDEFAQSYRDRVAKDDTDGTAWMVLGLIELERGHDAAAAEAFLKAEQHRPDDPLAPYYLGQALVLVGQPEKAAEAFERAITRKPSRQDLLEIFQALGRVHQRARRNAEALKVWDRLEQVFPDDLGVKEQIATILAEEGQHAEAAKRFAALAGATDDLYRQVTYRMQAAGLKVRLGKTDEALQDFEGLLGRLRPDSWLYREVRRQIEDVFRRDDDLAGLAKYYAGWIKKHPEDVEAMARLGEALAAQGRAPEAREWFAKAIELAPSNRELRLSLIEQLTREGKVSEAVAQYEALDEADPNNPDTIRAWGALILQDESLAEAERRTRAVAVWKRLLANRPDDPVTTAQVADLLREAKLTDEALALYKQAVELAPNDPQYREYLGEYLHVLKRPEDAVAAWRPMAEGPNRSVPNLARLAEVLAGFGYREPAIAAMQAAQELDPQHFNNRVRHAQLLTDVGRYRDALAQLDTAATLAESDEEQQLVLQEQIKNYQGAETLGQQIAALQGELDKEQDATAARWYRLACLLQADRRMTDATAAVRRALELDPQSIPVALKAAEIYESSGNLNDAVATYRQLATTDRRFRSEHLGKVASLQMRLGRHDEALQAARDRIDSAPGNPEHYQSYAQMCFQLGRPDDGFDALRRAVRVNPSDVGAVLTLAGALADQFRTAEAIELYWQAFEKSESLDDKLATVARLTEMSLRTNHLDRLLERLERIGREENQPRETALCLAQAYQSASDLGSARQELERLVTEETRDTQLLEQLVQLCAAEEDFEAAARYQRRLSEIAPTPDGKVRLAQFYLRAGEIGEAEALWRQFAEGEQEPHRLLQVVDHLLAHDQRDTALAITERMLREDPRDWEALYRHGVALAGADRQDDAAKRFQAILDLNLPDDEQSAQAQSRANTARPTARAVNSRLALHRPAPIQARTNAIWQLRQAIGLMENRSYYGGSVSQSAWGPDDFGQARMAALGWLYKFADEAGAKDEFLKAREPAADQTARRTLWDWYYLNAVLSDSHGMYEASRRLPVETDPEAAWLRLRSLSGRIAPAQRSTTGGAAVEIPPLTDEELEQALTAYRTLESQHPEWIDVQILSQAMAELNRAERPQQAEALYQARLDAATSPEYIIQLMQVAPQDQGIDAILALFDRLERSRGAQPGYGTALPHVHYLTQIMQARAEKKAYPDLIRLTDRYIRSLRRLRGESPSFRRQMARSASGQGQIGFSIRTSGNNSQYIQIDYPQANAYYDSGAITMLRFAFEMFRQADLTSDLFAHYREQADGAADEDLVYARLALAYLHWWNDKKDQTAEQMILAAKAAPADVDLQLEVAELKQQQGDAAGALDVLDAVQPLDHEAMQRREILALNLSVTTGDIGRARQAAERLFGLRLDSQLQIQLANQMHQLGMHELAEAVLARARRRAGNQTSTLLSLMQQYQRQGDTDTAVQIAHHLLRRAGTRNNSPYRTSEDVAREQALRLLARSGHLEKQIARLQKQLERSPESVPLHQRLADYYTAAGRKEEARAVYDRLLALRPDDAMLQYQLAEQLAAAADHKGACDHYLQALKQQPNLLQRNYYEVQRTFQQASRTEDLVEFLMEIDLGKSIQYHNVDNIIRELLREPKTQPQGLALLKKAWDAFPGNRQYLLGNLRDDSIWKLPELYQYVREGVIPTPEQAQADPWFGVGNVNSWSSNGTATGLVTQVVKLVEQQSKAEELIGEVEAALTKAPQWRGGQGLLAVLYTRRGRIDEAKSLLTALLKDEDAQLPSQAGWLLGQELEAVADLQPLTIRLYERAMDDTSNRRNGISYSPLFRLAKMYQQAGRRDDARTLLVDASHDERKTGANADYNAYRWVEDQKAVAEQLVTMGFPVDAVRIYNRTLSDSEALTAARRSYNGDFQLERGLKQALDKLNPETFAQALQQLTQPVARDDDAEDRAAIDLILLVQPADLTKAEVTSLFQRAVAAVVQQKAEVIPRVEANLSGLRERHPQDLSVEIAAALVAFQQPQMEHRAEAARRLLAAVEDAPLEDIPAGTAPNARQREAAARQLGLWLVAREAWQHETTREIGDRLAERAVQAARRQSDALWILAMLRERGQRALDAGDRAQAEHHWSEMLDLILHDGPPAADRRTSAVPRFHAPRGNASPRRSASRRVVDSLRESTSTRGASGLHTARGACKTCVPTRSVGTRIGLRLPVAVLLTAAIGQTATAAPAAEAAQAEIITEERWRRAMQVAKLAAEHGMADLSLRAVRESLAGGPPINPIPLDTQRSGIISSRNDTAQFADIFRQIEEQIVALNPIWRQKSFAADRVYETLADVVLPPGRETEIFLYPRPLARGGIQQPRSVGRLLAEWAAEAQRADDLLRRIAPRAAQPTAALSAAVLRGQIGLARGQTKAVNESLTVLAERLKSDSLQHTAELVCHVALPALSVADTADKALPVIDRAADSLAQGDNEEPMASLALALARHHFDRGRMDQGRQRLEQYLQVCNKMNVRYSGDYGLYRRKQQLQRVAHEMILAGLLEPALDALGEEADIVVTSRYGTTAGANAAATLSRLLAQRSAAERYELLRKWTMPTPDRRSVRMLTDFVPATRPPSVFARAVGQEPNESAFARLETGVTSDVFSTAEALIDAAKELGRLDALASECAAPAAENVENAPQLALMIGIARGQAETIRPQLEAHLDTMRKNLPPHNQRDKQINMADFLLARAMLAEPVLLWLGTEMVDVLVDHSKRIYSNEIRAHLWRLEAVARLNSKQGDRGLLRQPNLALWHPASYQTAGRHAAGSSPSLWLAQDGYVAHLSGPMAEFLLFDYPLTGTFEVSADVWDGGWAEGGMSYGGLIVRTLAHNQTSEVRTVGHHGQKDRPAPYTRREAFNRYTIQVRPDRLRVLVNGHPLVDEENPSRTSPFLALFGDHHRRAFFRNIEITGTPEIPREVPLIDGNRLWGWTGSFYGETMWPQFGQPTRPMANGDVYFMPPSNGFDWRAARGVIHGRRDAAVAQAEPVPSRLAYHRPLRDGESLSYEFFHVPGEYEVHPALGRLTFLLEPEGVRLHWMTDGPDKDWTGLPTDNAVAVPEERRGPARLPLVAGDWNRLTVALAGDTAQITLNDELIYERPLTAEDDRTFGLFHYKDRSAVQVRNAVLRGDWPERLERSRNPAHAVREGEAPAEPQQPNGAGGRKRLGGSLALPAGEASGPLTPAPSSPQTGERKDNHRLTDEQMADLMAPAGRQLTWGEGFWHSDLIEEARYESDVLTLVRQAEALPPEERYALLHRFVLPNREHWHFCVYGDFTPTHPAPVAPEADETPEGPRIERGGELVSPALLLVDTAKELGRLDELYQQVEAVPTTDSARRRRPQTALLALIRMAQENDAEARAHLEELFQLLKAASPGLPRAHRIQDLIAVSRAMRRPALNPLVVPILDTMVKQTMNNHYLSDQWARQVRHHRAMARNLEWMRAESTPWSADPQIPHWTPVTHAIARSRGEGLPRAHWDLVADEIVHYPGHHRDYLYFNVPLRGAFEVQCKLRAFGWRETYLCYGGHMIGLRYTKKEFDHDRYGWPLPRGTFDPPLEDVGSYYDYRIVVRDGKSVHYVNGRPIHEQPLPAEADPWLAIYCNSANDGGVRDLTITGTPEVPESLDLSAAPDLLGWMTDYYGESRAGENADWRKDGAAIVGRKLPNAAGSFIESLIRYHRPLLEDGELEYEFFYQPGDVLAHPALDRLVFLLDPQGIKVHWLTDNQYERTGLLPDNATDEPDNRRGPDRLPLKENEWNRLKLVLEGDTVTLHLNGQPVYERRLERGNNRQFGLFHYKDATEARVRHVTYRGDWPKQLPAMVMPGS